MVRRRIANFSKSRYYWRARFILPDFTCFFYAPEGFALTRNLKFLAVFSVWGMLIKLPYSEGSMAVMSTLFWDKKMKILILALATFAALC